MQESREVWQSKFGFILAAAGSAIGLGNIWRFPYMVGENGGAAFVFLYIIFVVLIGFAIMLAELSIGRKTQKNAYGAFKAIFPKTYFRWIGGLGIFTGIAILSFYSVIAGYTIGYIFKTIRGDFIGVSDPTTLTSIYDSLASNPMAVILLHGLFIFLTIVVVMGGVAKGIERWSKILMPVLFGQICSRLSISMMMC